MIDSTLEKQNRKMQVRARSLKPKLEKLTLKELRRLAFDVLGFKNRLIKNYGRKKEYIELILWYDCVTVVLGSCHLKKDDFVTDQYYYYKKRISDFLS